MSGDGYDQPIGTTALALNHQMSNSQPQGLAQPLAILDRLDKVNRTSTGFQALCPVHDDRNPSLTIDVDGGRVLLYCHGCGANGSDVCQRLNLDPGTFLFTDPTVPRENLEMTRYRYKDLQGSALFDVVRYADKGFALRLPDLDTGGIGDVEKVLYRLPEVAKAVEEGERVVVVEGEKDADRLVALGFAATTSPMGAGKWARCDSTVLDGAHVVVVPDNDQPGEDHAKSVVGDLHRRAIDVRIVYLDGLPDKGDVSDWLDAGGTPEALSSQIDETLPELTPSADKSAGGNPVATNRSGEFRFELGGSVLDLPETPESLWGEGAQSLWAKGQGLLIYAATGVGKTTLVQNVIIAGIGIGPSEVLDLPVMRFDGKVLYIAADRPRQAQHSLKRMLRESDRKILDEMLVLETKRQLRISPERHTDLRTMAEKAECSVVVIDSVKDVVQAISKDDSGGAFNAAVQDCVANGIDVVSLHHPRKTNQANPRKTLALDDVYGSTWVTAGQGSIIALNGTPGSGVAKFRHLKHPVDAVAGFNIEFDYATGSVSATGTRTVVEYLETQAGKPVSTPAITAYVEGTPDYTQTRAKAIRRELDGLATSGMVIKHEPKGSTLQWSLEDSAKDTSTDTPTDTHGHELPDPF